MKDLIVDCFAGGGGASVGIEMALEDRKEQQMGERNENNVEYTNQKEIDALNEKLKKIDENLKLGRFGVNKSNKAINAGLTIAEKGNKKKIDALKDIGFEIVDRFKEQDACATRYSRGRYRGYKMFVTMEKPLQ